MRRVLCLALALCWLGSSILADAQTAVGDAEIARGIHQVEEGDYDAAILTLDTAARRLAALPGRQADLAQAYLYLGVAYLGKGHETSARARFRDALAQARDLNLTPDKFAPKVIEMFEKAREEAASARPGPSPTASPSKSPGGKGGSKKALLIVGALAVAGAGVAVAAGGGGGGGTTLQTNTFANEVVVKGGGREYVVNVNGAGTLTAKVNWQQPGVILGMYIVALANTPQVLADGGQTGTSEAQLSLPVTAQAYRIAVTNSSGQGAQVDVTFTLVVTHP